MEISDLGSASCSDASTLRISSCRSTVETLSSLSLREKINLYLYADHKKHGDQLLSMAHNCSYPLGSKQSVDGFETSGLFLRLTSLKNPKHFNVCVVKPGSSDHDNLLYNLPN